MLIQAQKRKTCLNIVDLPLMNKTHIISYKNNMESKSYSKSVKTMQAGDYGMIKNI